MTVVFVSIGSTLSIVTGLAICFASMMSVAILLIPSLLASQLMFYSLCWKYFLYY